MSVHADTPADACGTHVRNHRCTLPAGHPAPCLMDRDLAVAWWGTKTTHRWAEPEQTGQITLLREAA